MNPETSDHDLLIEMRTVLRQAVKSIDDLKNGTHAQLADHEARIRTIENDTLRVPTYATAHLALENKVDSLSKLVWVGMGGVTILIVASQLLLPRFVH